MKSRCRRQFLHVAAAVAVLSVLSPVAQAQTYPSRPITIIVPFAAGGSMDTLTRILAERMRTSLAEQVDV